MALHAVGLVLVGDKFHLGNILLARAAHEALGVVVVVLVHDARGRDHLCVFVYICVCVCVCVCGFVKFFVNILFSKVLTNFG